MPSLLDNHLKDLNWRADAADILSAADAFESGSEVPPVVSVILSRKYRTLAYVVHTDHDGPEGTRRVLLRGAGEHDEWRERYGDFDVRMQDDLILALVHPNDTSVKAIHGLGDLADGSPELYARATEDMTVVMHRERKIFNL